MARRVDLDDNNCAKYSMECTRLGRAFQVERNFEIIQSDIGVRMYKSMRQKIPPHILRLASMWEATTSTVYDDDGDNCGVTAAEMSPLEPCCACGSDSGAVGSVQTCPVCLTSWHASCCVRVADCISSYDVAAARKAGFIEAVRGLPDRFVSVDFCEVCSRTQTLLLAE